jgi:drug/metabolite transporter (DMT)-like permease
VSATAIVLIAIAALMHASWNLCSKQAAAAGTAAFVWSLTAASTVIFAPVLAVYLIVAHPDLGARAAIFVAGSALLHVGYFLMLQRGYAAGDLSLVYPAARGSGLLLSCFLAIPLYGEQPGATGVAGILLIAGGVIVLSLPEGGAVARGAALRYGAATGVFIGAYTLWDKYAVSSAGVPPLLEEVGASAGVALLLLPLARRNAATVALLWRDYRGQVLGAGILSPLAYVLVLTALVYSPVSSIAPAREVSVLIGVLLGRRLLGEGNVPRRLAAAAAITAGVTAIIIG